MNIKLPHWFFVSMILVLFGFWYSSRSASAAELIPSPDKYTFLGAQPFSLNVGGTIITDTIWTLANSPYLVDSSITIANGVLLTIEPGVEVRFSSDTSMDVNGALRAIGTALQPITFTTANPTPQPGQWQGIIFGPDSDDSRNRMEYTSIRYGGDGLYCNSKLIFGALLACSASPTLINITISDSSSIRTGSRGFQPAAGGQHHPEQCRVRH